MPPEKPEEPTPAEWKVLRHVWQDGPCAASDVVAAVAAQEGWSVSTVKTLLRRLVEKGFLRTRRVGTSFLYSATRSPLGALRRAGETLLERAGEGTVGPLLAHLVRRGRMSREELARLRDLIDERCEAEEDDAADGRTPDGGEAGR